MACKATTPGLDRSHACLSDHAGCRVIRAALDERLGVMSAACAAAGTTFSEWYHDGAEIGDGARIFRIRRGQLGALARRAWDYLRGAAEAADLTVLELLWAYQLSEEAEEDDRCNECGALIPSSASSVINEYHEEHCSAFASNETTANQESR